MPAGHFRPSQGVGLREATALYAFIVQCDASVGHRSGTGQSTMTPTDFVAKWQSVRLSERSACQQHFCDLCDLLDHPKPAEADPEGTHFTFERGVHKTGPTQSAGGCLTPLARYL